MNKKIMETETSYSFEQDDLRCTILGLGSVGKSNLTLRFVLNSFEEDYIPTLEDTHKKELLLDGKTTNLCNQFNSNI